MEEKIANITVELGWRFRTREMDLATVSLRVDATEVAEIT